MTTQTFDPASFVFEPATVPVIHTGGVGRPAAPNPFVDVVNGLKFNDRSSAVSFFVPGPASTDTETGNADLRRIRRQLDDAGLVRKGANGELEQATVRWTFARDTRDGIDGAKVTIWVMPKIQKPSMRKNNTTPANDTTENASK